MCRVRRIHQNGPIGVPYFRLRLLSAPRSTPICTFRHNRRTKNLKILMKCYENLSAERRKAFSGTPNTSRWTNWRTSACMLNPSSSSQVRRIHQNGPIGVPPAFPVALVRDINFMKESFYHKRAKTNFNLTNPWQNVTTTNKGAR